MSSPQFQFGVPPQAFTSGVRHRRRRHAPKTAVAQPPLVRVALAAGHEGAINEGARLTSRAVTVTTNACGRTHPMVADALLARAQYNFRFCRRQSPRLHDAAEDLKCAESILSSAFGDAHPARLVSLAWRVAVHDRAGIVARSLFRALVLEVEAALDATAATESRTRTNERLLTALVVVVRGRASLSPVGVSSPLAFANRNEGRLLNAVSRLAKSIPLEAATQGSLETVRAIDALNRDDVVSARCFIRRARALTPATERCARDELAGLSALAHARVALGARDVSITASAIKQIDDVDNALRVDGQTPAEVETHALLGAHLAYAKAMLLQSSRQSTTARVKQVSDAELDQCLTRGRAQLDRLPSPSPHANAVRLALECAHAKLWRRYGRDREAIVLLADVLRRSREPNQRARIAFSLARALADQSRTHQFAAIHFFQIALSAAAPQERANAAHNLGVLLHSLDDTRLNHALSPPSNGDRQQAAARFLGQALRIRLTAEQDQMRTTSSPQQAARLAHKIGQTYFALGAVAESAAEESEAANATAALVGATRHYERAVFYFRKSGDRKMCTEALRELAFVLDASGHKRAAGRLLQRLAVAGDLERPRTTTKDESI